MLERLEPDPRDDIYALACMTYELMTGRHPFNREDALTARSTGRRVQRSDALTRRQFKAIERALRFDREVRTATVEQFVDELLGSPPASRWLIPLGVVVLIALAAGAYWLNTLRLPPAARVIPVPHAPAVAAPTVLTPGKLFRDCPTCPLMLVLPPGQFEQGAAADDAQATPFEKPRHTVAFAHSFAIGVNEITRGEFRDFVMATKREMRGCETYEESWKNQPSLSWDELAPIQTPQHPMSCVSWQDAQAYAQWLSSKTGHRYRLPSASEWEYAAAPSEGELCAQANVADQTAAERYPGWTVQPCHDGYAQAAPVGTFAANAFGLHDMLGNVFEWTEDCWQDDYARAPANGSAQRQGSCEERELRGGSWFTAPAFVRRSYRNRFEADYRSTSVGLRIARDVDP
jgi:formylglycine-generating enzyme required for sulfatase activity